LAALNVPPVAALGTMAYGPPTTVAEDAAPVLVGVTLPTVSLPTSPLVVNALPVKVLVVPNTLLALLAVRLKAACVMSAVLVGFQATPLRLSAPVTAPLKPVRVSGAAVTTLPVPALALANVAVRVERDRLLPVAKASPLSVLAPTVAATAPLYTLLLAVKLPPKLLESTARLAAVTLPSVTVPAVLLVLPAPLRKLMDTLPVPAAKAIAPQRGFAGYQTLLKAYLSEGLRRDEAQFAAVQQARLIEALKKRGVSAQLIEDAERELHAA